MARYAPADVVELTVCGVEHPTMFVRCGRDHGHDGDHRGQIPAIDITWTDAQATAWVDDWFDPGD